MERDDSDFYCTIILNKVEYLYLIYAIICHTLSRHYNSSYKEYKIIDKSNIKIYKSDILIIVKGT